jgi:nucleotide-binding universal stress UspA family protein
LTDVTAFLASHGVKGECRQIAGNPRTAGQAILDAANDFGADCIICGAYGRSRLQELVLGGVTRRLLATSHLPCLFAH